MYSNSERRQTRIDPDALRDFGSTSQPMSSKEKHYTQDETPSNPRAGNAVPVAGSRRTLLPENHRTNSTGSVSYPKPPAARKYRTETAPFVKHQSPWDKYQKSHCIRLGEGEDHMVDVADMRHPWSDDIVIPPKKQGPTPYVVTVRSFLMHNGEEKCRMLQQLEHENIVSVRDIFCYKGSYYAVFEHMPMSLSLFTGFQKHLNEDQLASIILKGLAYLAAEELEHGSLTSSNILINVAGDVKIANQELCQRRRQSSPRSQDIQALGFITMELMQKYAKADGAIGVEDIQRWRPDCLAMGFLSATTSVTSAEKLLKHPLFSRPWGNRNLQGLADITLIAPFRGYKLPPN